MFQMKWSYRNWDIEEDYLQKFKYENFNTLDILYDTTLCKDISSQPNLKAKEEEVVPVDNG